MSIRQVFEIRIRPHRDMVEIGLLIGLWITMLAHSMQHITLSWKLQRYIDEAIRRAEWRLAKARQQQGNPGWTPTGRPIDPRNMS